MLWKVIPSDLPKEQKAISIWLPNIISILCISKYYYYPVATKDITVNENLYQNPFWE